MEYAVLHAEKEPGSAPEHAIRLHGLVMVRIALDHLKKSNDVYRVYATVIFLRETYAVKASFS